MTRPRCALLLVVVLVALALALTTACGARQRAAETPTALPPASPTGQPVPAANATAGSGLLKSYRVLVTPDAGRVDWGSNGQIVFSRIKNLTGGGDLSSEIYVMNPDGSNQVCLTCDKPQIPHLSNDQPAWRSNGDFILFQSADPNLPVNGVAPAEAKRLVQGGFGYNNNLWVMTSDGTAFYELTHITAAEATLHPHFSPDGSKVFWSASEPRRTGGQGWVLRLADFSLASGQPSLENVQTLTPLGVSGSQVYESHDVTADNSTLLYSYSPSQPLDLDTYETHVTTNKSTNLTNSAGVWDEHAHYSPDGKRIAWVSSHGYPFTPNQTWEQTLRTDVWLMNADGSNQQQVTYFNTPGKPGATGGRVIMADLAWSPDGTSIVALRSNIGPGDVSRDLVVLDLAPTP